MSHASASARPRGIALTLVALLTLALLPAALFTAAHAGAGEDTSSSRIGALEDPTDVSIAISQATIPDGQAERVYLGRDNAFPDNLAGAAATGTTSALLLHPAAPAGLDSRVIEEIARLIGTREQAPPCEAGSREHEVIILGGTVALSQQLEDDLVGAGLCVTRLSGQTRVETSVAVARFLAGFSDSVPILYVATAGNPADSASASSPAAINGAPIVVTGSSALDPAIAAFIADFPPQQIYLLGGTAALSAQVESDLTEAAPGAMIQRLAGATRDDTAAEIARSRFPDVTNSVAIVNGFSEDFWVWALTGAVAASRESSPVLYVQAGSVPDPTRAWLDEVTPTSLLAVGPTSQISDETLAAASGGSGSQLPEGPPTHLYLDQGVVYNADGEPQTFVDGPAVASFDVDHDGDLAYATADGDLFCFCDGSGEPRVLMSGSDTARAYGPVFTPDDGPILFGISRPATVDLASVEVTDQPTPEVIAEGFGPPTGPQSITDDGSAALAIQVVDGQIFEVLLADGTATDLGVSGIEPVYSQDADVFSYWDLETGTWRASVSGAFEPVKVSEGAGTVGYHGLDLVAFTQFDLDGAGTGEREAGDLTLYPEGSPADAQLLAAEVAGGGIVLMEVTDTGFIGVAGSGTSRGHWKIYDSTGAFVTEGDGTQVRFQ